MGGQGGSFNECEQKQARFSDHGRAEGAERVHRARHDRPGPGLENRRGFLAQVKTANAEVTARRTVRKGAEMEPFGFQSKLPAFVQEEGDMAQESFLEELERLRMGDAVDLETVIINGQEYAFKRLIMRDGVLIFQKIDTITNGKVEYREIVPSRREALDTLRSYVAGKKTKRQKGGNE